MSPLFICERDGAVENTALGQYWGAEEKLCSECATGEWHGMFQKLIAPPGFSHKMKGEFLSNGALRKLREMAGLPEETAR